MELLPGLTGGPESRPPAVDADDLPGDPTCLIGKQEDNKIGNICTGAKFL
jgi:hypothetical protein